MESVEARLKRIEIENLTIRETIWELSRRVAIVETLVRTHIVYPGNNVSIDTLLGPVPPTKPKRDSGSIGELCNRLSKLEVLVQNLAPNQKGPIPNGSGPFIFQQPSPIMHGGSYRIPTAPLPVFTSVPFNPMQINIPSNTVHIPDFQKYPFGESFNHQKSGDYFQKPPGFFTENINKNLLEIFSVAKPTSSSTTGMNIHPKTVDKFGQEFPVKSPLPAAAINISTFGGGSGKSEQDKKLIPLSVELATQAISLPSPCTKLCGKLTGHACGQNHSSKSSCPPCQVLLEDFKLKCGHEVNVHCYVKSSRDFKCSQCEQIKMVPQNVSTAPFPTVKTKTETVNQKPQIEATKTPLKNFTPSAIPKDETSWLEVEWGDEDDATTESSTTTNNTTTGIKNDVKTTENSYITKSMESETKMNDQKQLKGNDLPTTSSVKSDVPLSYAQLVTQQQTSSATRNISPASSISGVSTTSSKMAFNVEETVKRYMKVNSQNKASRKNWISYEFKKYTNNQRNSFIRHLTRHSVNLSRGTLAGVGQLLNVMIELKLTSNELVIQAFLTGIISDLPKIQKESQNEFELIGENVCYLLVATFEHEPNLNWLVSLGYTLKESKPAIWGIISTTVLDLIVHRKNERGLKTLYLQTTTLSADTDKLSVLSQAMKALNVRV